MSERSFQLLKTKKFLNEMFHECFEKQFTWNLMLRYTMKLTINQYFMNYTERKILQCSLHFRNLNYIANETYQIFLFLHDSKIIFSPTFVMANSSGPGNARNLHFDFRQNTSSITTRVLDIKKGNNYLPAKNVLKWGGVVKM